MPNINKSVKFYTLSSLPAEVQDNSRDGCFINLMNSTDNNPDGLYFCFNNHWRYLVNVDQEVRSAVVYNNVMYFYTYAPAPTPTQANPPTGYLFSVNLPVFTGGSGVDITSGGAISIDLAADTVTVTGTAPNQTVTTHTGSENLLKINPSGELSINDTWDCGEYDNDLDRHMQHLKSSSMDYIHILKSNIPDGVDTTQITSYNGTSSFPDPNGQNAPQYVQDSTNNWYYVLGAVKPDASSLKYGEIAVNYNEGNERLYIKNSNNGIVEFAPANQYRNFVRNATFTNPQLTPVSSVCTWSIPYSYITGAGIGTSGAVVFLREEDTNGRQKQLIPDVTFDDTNSRVDILIYSTTAISAGKLTAIVFGSNYNNI